jgi:hypothetical protein
LKLTREIIESVVTLVHDGNAASAAARVRAYFLGRSDERREAENSS